MQNGAREVDVARAERVRCDRARKAKSALVLGGYLEDDKASVNEDVVIDFLTDLLHLVPDLGEAVNAPARLRQLADHAVSQFRRESS